jgi:hypothetical protein
MPRKSSTVLLLAALLAAGCTTTNPHSHGGQIVCEHHPDDKPDTTTAPYKATYVLHQWKLPPQDQPPPHYWSAEHEVAELYLRTLEEGEKVGFEKGDKGELFAVAGNEKILLEPGRYCWHISPGTQRGAFRQALATTGEVLGDLIVGIVALPLGIVFLILLLPLLILCLPAILLIGLLMVL